jgi:hypothetical protein
MRRLFWSCTTPSALLFTIFVSATAHAAEWGRLLDRPPTGANTIALFNADELRYGAVKLKSYKDGEQVDAANDIVAEIPDGLQSAALAANLDFDSLRTNWEYIRGEFSKKLGTPRVIADQEGGYLDKISGRTVIWTPRRRYLVPLDSEHMVALIPANRSAVSQWVRGLSQSPAPLPDFLKRQVDHASSRNAMFVAVDMADAISAVQAAEKVRTLKSVADSKLDPEKLGNLLGDLHGITLSVTAKDHFFAELRLNFGSSPTLLRNAGKDILVEICARRGILFAEMRDWNDAVEGNAFVLSGPIDAITIVNLLAFFKGIPANTDYHSPGSSSQNTSEADRTADILKASKRYFSSVQKILKESRTTKGLSISERGAFNDKLSHKIDDLPLLNVDPELLDYGQQVAELMRGAGYVIRSANVAAGGQKATQASSSSYFGYGWGGSYGSYSFNDNTAYNESLTKQAHADGTQAHLTNMQQVDTLTAQIRRTMTEKYKTEF